MCVFAPSTDSFGRAAALASPRIGKTMGRGVSRAPTTNLNNANLNNALLLLFLLLPRFLSRSCSFQMVA